MSDAITACCTLYSSELLPRFIYISWPEWGHMCRLWGQPGYGPPIIKKRPCFHQLFPPFVPNILVCPSIFFTSLRNWGSLFSLHSRDGFDVVQLTAVCLIQQCVCSLVSALSKL